MGALDFFGLPKNALLLTDSAPIIYVLEEREFAERFLPLFELHRAGEIRLAVTTTAIVEVLTGPYAMGDEVLVRRYRTMFASWQIVALDVPIAESAARFRADLRLKLSDAIQAASALAINADALVTHDRDFSRVKGLRVIC
jgi:predicted nucleic acid-binding protein